MSKIQALPDGDSAPVPQATGEETEFRALVPYFHRYDCYFPQPPRSLQVSSQELLPILISTDLLLIGGFDAGLKLAKNPRLLLVFVNEQGQVFECGCSTHNPSRVITFFPRRFVRLRLFASEFYWEKIDAPLVRDLGHCAHVAIAVTDSEGERHHFTFPVTDGIRGLFPFALMAVT